MNSMFADKAKQLVKSAKETSIKTIDKTKEAVVKISSKAQETVTDFRIDKLSKLSRKTIAGIGAGALAVVVICGAFALAGPKEPEMALLTAEIPEEEQEEILTTYYAIKINGAPVAALATEAEAQAVLDGVLAHYSTEGSEIISVAYNETVETVEMEGDNPELMSVEEARTMLITGTKEPKVYTVVSGDNFWDIAIRNGMSVEELMASNPGMDENRLQIGSTLNLYELKPYVRVSVTERVTTTENIDYGITYEDTSTLYKGEIKVKSSGVYGKREVTREIVKENGAVVSKTEIASAVISEPSAQVNLRGTKSLATLVGTGSFASPMGRIEVSSPFGSRGGGRHTGVDLRNPKGTPIYAVDDGVVTYAGYRGSYGNIVQVSHGNGIETWYAHCDKMTVSVGTVVKKGDQIATVGITGRATGYHLHLEVRKNGVPQNPMNYL